MSLTLEGVSAGYGGVEILHDINLVAPRGKVTAMLGANGAGKTTLLRVASGLLPVRAGRRLLNDIDVSSRTAAELVDRGICHVPEGRAIFPSLTVRENLLLFERGVVDDPLDRAADAFPRLAERMGQQAGTMSGGEQQMLALARAYMGDPDFVLLDEVSMGLAPILVDEIFEFLGRLAERGAALLVVEQYVHRVLELADVVYVLSRGRIAFAGEPTEIDADRLAEEYLGAGTA